MAINKKNLSDLKFSLSQIKNNYLTDFGQPNKKLDNYIEDLEKKESKKIKINLSEVEDNTKEFWKELILRAVTKLLERIKNRKSRGSEFFKIKDDLEKTKKDLPYDNPDINTLRSYYEGELKKYREQIKEKIDIEKYNHKRFWFGLGIGFLLGIAAALVGGIIFR